MNVFEQIKEMAEAILRVGDNYDTTLREDCETIAELIYDAGYRKQNEGEWKIKQDDYDCEYMMCSCCKEEFYPVDEDTVDTTPNYCPNCGAIMNGGKEE